MEASIAAARIAGGTAGKPFMLFAGSGGDDFAQRMAKCLGTRVCASYVKLFSEGNIFVRADETVRDQDVVLVQPIGLNPNNEFVEILFWIDAFKRASAHRVQVVMPHFAYAKGDHKDEPRVSIRAKVCAECMELAGADSFVTMDLHSAQVQGFFKKPLDNLQARPLLCAAAARLGWDENAVIVATDAGAAKDARKYAKNLGGLPVAIGDKERQGHDENAQINEIIGSVRGKNALIIDDFSISGNTLANLAAELKKRGALNIRALLSHNMLSESGVGIVRNSDIEYVLTTDSVVNPRTAELDKIKILSAAPLFAEALLHNITHQSVSTLFDSVPDELLDEALAFGSYAAEENDGGSDRNR